MNTTMVPRSFIITHNKYPACVNGYFAGNAWLISDEAFHQISGNSFGTITFDDMTRYKEDKRLISKPTISQWNELSNEQKEFCYKVWSNPKDIVFYNELTN